MSDPSTIRVRARIHGRVQGVWYRGSTVETAGRLGLVGWVRNCADGTVELEAQGGRERVDALLAWCRTGPPAARVDRIDHEEIPVHEAETSFAIRR